MKQQFAPYKFNPGYYWYSFAGPRDDPQYTGPKGFLGASIVHADSFDQGLNKTWVLKINPDGSVLGFLLNIVPHEKWCNRLLSGEAIEEIEKEYPNGNN